MPTMINFGAEMLRISPKDDTKMEHSRDGRNWSSRGKLSASNGRFLDLIAFGTELYAVTTKGVYYSRDKGQNWLLRRSNATSTGDFLSLMANGDQLFANTTKGLFYSRDKGQNWTRK